MPPTILRTGIELTAKTGKATPPAVFYLMLAAVENETPPATDALCASPEGPRRRADDPSGRPGAGPGPVRRPGRRRPRGEALASVEAKAKEDPKGPFRRVLVEKLREQKQYDRAEQLLAELHKEFPDESNLAAALVQVVSLQAAEAASRRADRTGSGSSRTGSPSMIREYRARYPDATAFLQAECDMAARRGDFTQAIALTREIDKVARTSTLGPLLRVRLFTMLDRPDEVARAYGEAIDRERGARQLDYRILLGQVRLKMGDADEAMRQAGLVLAVEKKRLDAAVLHARALAEIGGNAQREGRAPRRAALARLHDLIKDNPDFPRGLSGPGGRPPEGRRACPGGRRAQGRPAGHPDRRRRRRSARAVAVRTPAGRPSTGGVRPGRGPAHRQRDRRRRHQGADDPRRGRPASSGPASSSWRCPWPGRPLPSSTRRPPTSPSATSCWPSPRGSRHRTRPREAFVEAVAEYDRVLKAVPDSIEAVNNKAWILHTYLGKSREALELVLALQKRAVPVALPCEFFDTLGAIQESVGQTRDAEASYLEGLKKDPRNPALNFHFGKLLLGRPQPRRQGQVLPDQGPGRPRTPQPHHGPRGRSARPEPQ